MNRPVIAGVDGSPASLNAAGYAADTAASRALPLELLHAYPRPFRFGVPLDLHPAGPPAPSNEARRMIEAAAERLRSGRPGLTVSTRQVPGGAAAALMEASDQAELIVVGSRGHGGFTGLLLGSVSSQVAAHARAPVLVVRPDAAPRGPVAVGVDGSPGSDAALAYAADEAALRTGELLLVHVWWAGALSDIRETYAETEKAARASAEAVLSVAATAVRESHPGLAIGLRMIHGLEPERHLVEASREAALVAIGSRGRGGLTTLLLGSVSQALVHHAHCPVLVAHARVDAAPPRR